MKKPRAVLFDLDDTLAESFQPPSPEMIERLSKLLEMIPIAIISAAGWPRIEHQFLEPLSQSPHIGQFFVFPNSSSQCYAWHEFEWRLEYDMSLNDDELARIHEAITSASHESGIIDPAYEPKIIDRGSQIAYAAVGLDAPAEVKRSWDPDQSKRNHLKAILEERIPDVEVRIGGMTTIDITKKGIDKAYGVNWLAKKLSIPTDEMLFVGDALFPGGNDAVVIPTGIQTRSTSGPTETSKIIDDVLALLTN